MKEDNARTIWSLIGIGIVIIVLLLMSGCQAEDIVHNNDKNKGIHNVNNATLFITELDSHEYVHSWGGGIIHKVNCKYHKND